MTKKTFRSIQIQMLVPVMLSFSLLFFGCNKDLNLEPKDVDLYGWKPNRTLVLQNGDSLKVYDPYYNAGTLRLKGQMHCHTKNSDGLLTPEQLADLYYENGYDFWTITDHNRITPEPANNRIIWLFDSYEHTDWDNHYHLCYYNVSKIFPFCNDINMAINFVLYDNSKSWANYAHPDWNPAFDPYMYQSNEVIKKVSLAKFTEILNRGYLTRRAFDILLTQKKKVWGLGVNDFHANMKAVNTSFVNVCVNERNSVAIWNSLLKGSFFATNGAKMDISLSQDGVISVSSDITGNIVFYGKEGKILKQFVNASSGTYQIVGDEVYVRCEVFTGLGNDSSGSRCCSQPIWLEDIVTHSSNSKEQSH